MLKQVFNAVEKTLLKELLLEGREEFLGGVENSAITAVFIKRYIKPIDSAIGKIEGKSAVTLIGMEKAIALGRIQLYRNKLLGQLHIGGLSEWFCVTPDQIEIARRIDLCSDIQHKLGKKFDSPLIDPAFRYGDIIESMVKLRKTRRIFYSTSQECHLSDLGFLFDDRELLLLDPSRDTDLLNFSFFTPNGVGALEYCRSRFSAETDSYQSLHPLFSPIGHADRSAKTYDFLSLVFN